MADTLSSSDTHDQNDSLHDDCNRRRFLQRMCAGALVAAGTHATVENVTASTGKAEASRTLKELPTITIGKYQLTRLIVGSNPIAGYSHSTVNLSNHMREYFTVERTVKFIQECEQMGINAWQTGGNPDNKISRALNRLREQGSKIHWFCLARDMPNKEFNEILAQKPIAIVHHGGVTDRLFHNGEASKVHDFVKRVHDAGIMAGVSSHNPKHIAHVEEKGWENEFFMTSFYNLTRPSQEIRDKLGTVPLGSPFLESDRDEMTKVVQEVKRPCLAFKILAAGRLCWQTSTVESAFNYAFRHIKKTDGVIVGMYPRFSDELSHNVELTLKHSHLS